MALQDSYPKGSTGISVPMRILGPTGAPLTSVTWNSSGIDLWYRRERSARVAITEATLAALTTSHTPGGFLHVSDGDYTLDLPDAAAAGAAGVRWVEYGGTVTGGTIIGGRVKLEDAAPMNWLTATGIATDAITKIAAGVWAKLLSSDYNGLSTEEALSVILASQAGEVTGADPEGPGPVHIKNLAGTADVIVSDGDGLGNRNNVVVTP